MTSRARALSVLFLPLFLIAPAAGTATVSGRVLDSSGTPVRGAKVVWEKYRSDEEVLVDETKGTASAPLGETATDSDGRFQVKVDKPGIEVAIRVLPATLAGAFLSGPYDASEDVEVDDIELPAAENISGRVTDEAGKPVAGAKVRAAAGSLFEEEGVPRYAETSSGADGSFTIANAPGKSGSLVVRAAGFAPSTQFSMQRSGVERVTLKKGGTVAGTVLDAAGKPVEGVLVVSGSLAVRTDASGTYRLEGVPRGTQTLEALGKDDLGARNDSVRVKAGETADVPLKLARSASVTGSVIDEKTRRPLAGVRVSARAGGFSFRQAEPATRRARTDAKGKFLLVGLATRSYSIRASKTDYIPATFPGIPAAVSAPGTVAIALTRAATVSGRVMDEKGAAVAGARVRFVADEGLRAILRNGPAAFLGRPGVGTRPDGTFRLRGLSPEKNLTLEAARSGFVPARRPGITLRPGEIVKDVTLVLKRGLEARGRVVDAAGQPVAGAEIRLSRPERGGNRFMVMMGGMGQREKPDASSGPDGSFRVGGLEAAEYALAVSHEGYAVKRVPSVTVVAEGPNDWPPVVLSPGSAIAGFVRNAKGEAVVGAQIFTFAVNAGPGGSGSSDPEGRFRLDGFDSGRAVMLSVRADGYGSLQRQVTPPSEDLSLVLKTTGTIRGRVGDAATNRPVPDFTVSFNAPMGFGGVQIRMGGGDNEKSFQSSDGTFELTDVPPGKWKVSASASGYRPSEVAGIDVGEAETKEGVVLSLKKGGSLSGRVLDPRRGTGVANASVSWSEGSGGPQFPGAAALARFTGGGTAVSTDADGRYRLDGLPTGKVTVAAEHPDYLKATREVDVEDEATADLTLSVGGSIAGSVVGKDGRSAVVGAQVTLDEQGGSTFGMGEDTARADGTGAFLFEHLKAGRYRLSAKSNAGSSSWKDVVLAESQRLDGVLLVMEGGALIRGTVSGLLPARLGGIRIYATGSDYEDSAVTGDDGRFTLSDVPAGVVRVAAMTSFPSGKTTWKNVEVPEGASEVPVEIVFEGSSRLAGRVTRGDRPVPDVNVTAVADPPGAGDSRAMTRTDDTGQYAIEGLTDGNYQVLLNGSGVSYRRMFAVSGDTSGDIALPSVSVSGVVTEAGSNDPIEGASVQIQGAHETDTFRMKRAVTDSRGSYSVDDLDPGDYQLTARKDGYQLKTQPLSIGSSSEEQNVSLERGSGLSVRAADGLTAIPLRSIYALAYSAGGSIAYSGMVTLDSEGKGEIASLAPGSYSLSVFSDGYAPRSFPAVIVPSPPLAIGLTPGGRVEIRTEAPLTGLLVDGSGAVYRMSSWRLDGRISASPPVSAWDHIAPGSYQLVVSGAGGDRSYPFTVSEGRTTTVEAK
jgi:protocatechuate 3,4-dioxygenase beta subunit